MSKVPQLPEGRIVREPTDVGWVIWLIPLSLVISLGLVFYDIIRGVL